MGFDLRERQVVVEARAAAAAPLDQRPEVALEPRAHRQRFLAITRVDGAELAGDVMVKQVAGHLLNERRRAEAGVAGGLDHGVHKRPVGTQDVADAHARREHLGKRADFVGDAQLIRRDHRAEGFGVWIVQQRLVGQIVNDRNQPVLPARQRRRHVEQRAPAPVREDGAGGVVDRDGVEERDLRRRVAQRLQFALERAEVDSLVVLRHGQHVEAAAHQAFGVDVVHRIGGHHDAAGQHIGQCVQQAGRAAGADGQALARQRGLVQLAHALLDQKTPQRRDQVGRAGRTAVVERLPVAHGVAGDGLHRFSQMVDRDRLLIHVSDTEVDVDAVAEAGRELRHHAAHGRGMRGGLAVIGKMNAHSKSGPRAGVPRCCSHGSAASVQAHPLVSPNARPPGRRASAASSDAVSKADEYHDSNASGGPPVRLRGLNRPLRTAATGAVSEYVRIEETIAPAALETITQWIRRQTGLEKK